MTHKPAAQTAAAQMFGMNAPPDDVAGDFSTFFRQRQV
jgi:hypothetical protein